MLILFFVQSLLQNDFSELKNFENKDSSIVSNEENKEDLKSYEHSETQTEKKSILSKFSKTTVSFDIYPELYENYFNFQQCENDENQDNQSLIPISHEYIEKNK